MKKLLLFALAIFAGVSALAAVPASAIERKSDDSNQRKITIKKKDSCRAYLGIYMDELSGKLIRKYDYPEKNGVLVVEVIEDSPAAKAGLEEDDIIYRFNGEKVDGAQELSSMVQEMKPGDQAEIVFYRNGGKKTVTVTLGESPEEVSVYDIEDYAQEIGDFAGRLGKSIGYWWRDALGIAGRLGVELVELDEDLAGYFDVKKDEGVLILRVHEDSPAEAAGLKPGDVIVEVNGAKVSSVDDIREELRDREDETVAIGVVRKGERRSFDVALEKGDRFFYLSPRAEKRIVIPERRFEAVNAVELQKELDELKAELKEMKKRLKELEKE